MFHLSKPVPITLHHELGDFESGEPSLDEWLKKRALKNQVSGASRCFVLCNEEEVIGYYGLSTGAINHSSALKAIRRNMPDPLPVLLLGRLAIDRKHHNLGLGSALLRDAMLRVVNIASEVGIVAMIVHAISEPAKQFYLSRGFVESPLQPMTLIMTLKTVHTILSES